MRLPWKEEEGEGAFFVRWYVLWLPLRRWRIRLLPEGAINRGLPFTSGMGRKRQSGGAERTGSGRPTGGDLVFEHGGDFGHHRRGFSPPLGVEKLHAYPQ